MVPTAASLRLPKVASPKWTDRHRHAIRQPRRLPVSKWAEEHRRLPPDGPEPGRWKNFRSPYLVGVMDAFSDPEVEVIVIVSGAQVGKTECLLNMLGSSIDQDPGTTLLILPDEHTADKLVRHRFHPMVRLSPALAEHSLPKGLGLKVLRFDTCTVFTAWAGSPAAMASTPCRWVFGDELDKFPPYDGKEGNPVRLAEARTIHYHGRSKRVFSSTPARDTDYIWPLFERSTQYHYHLPCPHCGLFQVLDFFRGVKWEKNVSPLEVYERGLAWYECAGCQAKLSDQDKDRMLARGLWVPKGSEVKDGKVVGPKPRRSRVGYHISGLYSPLLTWGRAAQWFIESIGDAGMMHDFLNNCLGLPFREKIEVVTAAKIDRARRSYEVGTVPAGAKLLTAGVDVQATHLWFAVRAWGDHERSWLLRWGMLRDFRDLLRVLTSAYKSSAGTPLQIEMVHVDSGYRATEVYEFVRAHRHLNVRASKGSGNPGLISPLLPPSFPEVGVILQTFKADYWKDALAGYIEPKEDGAPGEWMVPDAIDDEYRQHMTAERKIWQRRAGRKISTWAPLTETTPNHLWDCEVLNVVGAHRLNVRFLHLESMAEEPAPPAQDRGRRKGKWLGSEERWLEGEGSWLGEDG